LTERGEIFPKKKKHKMIQEESGLNKIVKRVARVGETIPAVAFSEAAATVAAASFDAAESASWVVVVSCSGSIGDSFLGGGAEGSGSCVEGVIDEGSCCKVVPEEKRMPL
jgi:hypothetical protein